MTSRWCTKPKKEEALAKPSYLPPPQPVYAPQPPPTPAPQPVYKTSAPQPVYSSQPQPLYISSSPNNQQPTASPAYYKPLPGIKRKRTAGTRQSGRGGYGNRKAKLLTNDPQRAHW